MPPTVFADCKPDMTIVREEIFSPALAVTPCATPDEVVMFANDTKYGLAAALDAALPFGGRALSGYGKDLGPEQLDAFLHTQSVIVTPL
jgi:phenylacetaldehyde dehydrogenase